MNFMIKILLTVSTASILFPTIQCHAKTELKTAIENQEYQFVTMTFHDVRDDVEKSGDKDVYAISTRNLALYFSWLKREGWNPVRLEDVWLARQKKKTLPAKAVLITFDDGILSNYTRVYPLLKEYQIPAVFAVVTSWANGNHKAIDDAYGKGNALNWVQMREMKKSGLVEFVSHSDDLHKGILANPQNNVQPAAITREYLLNEKRYETDDEYRKRIITDLKKSKQILDHELGTDTKAIFWPYGAVSKESEELATIAGLPMSFSLGNVATLADSVRTYQRGLIMNNPSPEQIHDEMINFLTYARLPHKERQSVVGFNLVEMESHNNAGFDFKLGKFLENINALKSNVLLLDVVHRSAENGKVDATYFPNSQLPVQQDLLNRTLWQANTRIANRVLAMLPVGLETLQHYDLAKLAADLVKNNSSVNGIVLNAENELDCAIQDQKTDAICKQKVDRVFSILDQIKEQSAFYSNISTNYQSALKIDLKNEQQINGLNAILKQLEQKDNHLYLYIDPVRNSNIFKILLNKIRYLDDQEKQHLVVNFKVHSEMDEKDWDKYHLGYQALRALSIQRIGLDAYKMANAKTIHQKLYQDLSLNDSPVMYRNPFVVESKETR
nr:poly-beta-1,6-N-acetyl-D-glucosamine N-deacetylase PgaB [Acinetobacter sp. Marseille-Q1620]